MNEIINRAQAGDREAIEELYRLHRPFVYNYINKRVGNAADAEDLTSQVFIRAIEKLSQYREVTHDGFIKWLTRIAHNIMVDTWRKTNRVKVVPDVWALHGESAEYQTFLTLGEQDFDRFMDYLTPPQQEVILLKFVYDLSNEQVAERLETTVGAVKSIQHRAFDTLREKMDGISTNSHT